MEDYFDGRSRNAETDYDQIRNWVSLSGKSVLEVGCGVGGKCAFWSRQGTKFVIGIDPSLDRSALGQVISSDKTSAKFVQAEGERLPFPGEIFDVIIMHDVLEHLSNPGRVIRECYRVLKGCGKLSIITPHYRGLSGNHLWNYLDGRFWRYLHPHLTLPRLILRKLVFSVGQKRNYSDAQIRFEWHQFLALNRLKLGQIRGLLRPFRVEHLGLRQPEAQMVQWFARTFHMEEFFTYGVVIIAVKD